MCGALVVSPLSPVRVGGQCYDAVEIVTPPDVACDCDPLIPCPGVAKSYTGYKECLDVEQGSQECKYIGKVAFEVTRACTFRYYWPGILGCAAALILAGVAEGAACTNPAAIVTCWAIIAANMAAVFSACNYCAIITCGPGDVISIVYKDDHAVSGGPCPQ